MNYELNMLISTSCSLPEEKFSKTMSYFVLVNRIILLH